ncbi:MAG: glycosyltransferase family 2 protein [Bacteroidales bacterium]|nr:glycosyltransferase family 2 protein [Bacteroidales bacterium]
MKIAVVILNFNGEKLLNQYLTSVITHAQSTDCEIIVADNHSTDRSLEILSEDFPNIRVVKLDKNYGFAQGYNLALQQIDSDYYVLCNNDIELRSDAVTPLIQLLESNENAAAAMPKIKSLRNPQMFEYAGAAGGFIDRYGYPFCRGRILNNVEPDNGQYNSVKNNQIFWATGAFIAVKASVFKQLGGFDESFFAHMEEIDLCWRIKNIGMDILYCPEAEVYHLGGATLQQGSPQKLYLNYRNCLKMMFKNLPPKQLIPILWIRMILDGASAAVYLCKLQFKLFLSVLKAHFAFYASIPKLIGQRKKLKKTVKKYYHNEIFKGSIVYHSIIKKQKTFFEF